MRCIHLQHCIACHLIICTSRCFCLQKSTQAHQSVILHFNLPRPFARLVQRDAMDALRKSVLNLSICQDSNFGDDDEERSAAKRTKFNIISVFAPENGSVDVDPRNIQQLSEKQLIECLPPGHIGSLRLPPLSQTEEWHQCLVDTRLLPPKPQNTTATLNIIYVDNEKDSVTGMSQKALLKLFEVFGLDRSILHLLRRGADTWHCIQRDDETCAFLLIIQGLYYMACSFSPRGRETNCVIFGKPPKKIEDDVDTTNFNFYQPAWFCKPSPSNDRRVDNEYSVNEQTKFKPFQAFQEMLEKIQSHHLHHPLSLAYLGLVDSLSSIFIRVGKEVGSISELEDALDNVTEPIGDDKESLSSLISLFEKAGTASVTMARLSKVTGVASMLLQTLQDSNGWKRWCQRFFLTSSGSQYDRAAGWLAEGLPSCRQILQNEKLQIQSQDERVKALTPIVSRSSPRVMHRK